MATYTIFGDTTDGRIQSVNATYLTARSGSTLAANATTFLRAGQTTGFTCYEGFVAFDTSVIPDTDDVTAATLSLFGDGGDDSGTDFTLEARLHDWGIALGTGDWIAGASLGAQTLLASRSSAGWNASGYNALTSDAAMLTNINKTGFTRMILCSDRHRGGTQPTGDEWLDAESADAAGTTSDPKLVVDASRSVQLGVITQTAVAHAPSFAFDQQATLALIDQTAQIHTPQLILDQFATLALIDQTAQIYAPTLNRHEAATFPAIDQTAVAWAPELVREVRFATRRRTEDERVFWTIDGHPVELAGWSAGSSVNLGHNQHRGVALLEHALRLPWEVGQGSPVRGVTAGDVEVFEGRLAQDPKIRPDGLAHFAAQGYGFDAVNHRDRVFVKGYAPQLWSDATLSPFNWPIHTNVQIQHEDTLYERLVQYIPAEESTLLDFGDTQAMAMATPGSKLTRFRGGITRSGDAFTFIVMSADAFDIAQTARPEYILEPGGTTAQIDVTFQHPGDAVVLVMEHSDSSEGSGIPQWSIYAYNPEELTVIGAEVWGEDSRDPIYSGHVAELIAARLGFDSSRLAHRGHVPITRLDSAAGASSVLSYLAGLEDFMWRVLGDRGAGPVLEFGPRQRVWEVSAATGARWDDLTPVERASEVLVQYIDFTGALVRRTISSNIIQALQSPKTVALRANPDLLAQRGIENQARINLLEEQVDDSLPFSVAWHHARRLMEPRWRGRVSFGRVFDRATGREASRREVLAGDLLWIRDFDRHEGLLLPIDDVEHGLGPTVTGHEAPAIPTDTLTTHGTGRGDVDIASPGPQKDSILGQLGRQLPPGAPNKPDPGPILPGVPWPIGWHPY